MWDKVVRQNSHDRGMFKNNFWRDWIHLQAPSTYNSCSTVVVSAQNSEETLNITLFFKKLSTEARRRD